MTGQCNNDNGKFEKKIGATTSSRMNFSGYLGHATIFSCMLTSACCRAVGLGLGLGLDLVLVWLVVMHTYLYSFRCHCHLAQ